MVMCNHMTTIKNSSSTLLKNLLPSSPSLPHVTLATSELPSALFTQSLFLRGQSVAAVITGLTGLFCHLVPFILGTFSCLGILSRPLYLSSTTCTLLSQAHRSKSVWREASTDWRAIHCLPCSGERRQTNESELISHTSHHNVLSVGLIHHRSLGGVELWEPVILLRAKPLALQNRTHPLGKVHSARKLDSACTFDSTLRGTVNNWTPSE